MKITLATLALVVGLCGSGLFAKALIRKGPSTKGNNMVTKENNAVTNSKKALYYAFKMVDHTYDEAKHVFPECPEYSEPTTETPGPGYVYQKSLQRSADNNGEKPNNDRPLYYSMPQVVKPSVGHKRVARSTSNIAANYDDIYAERQPSMKCPIESSSRLHPCVCKTFPHGIHVACERFDSREQFASSFRVLDSYTVMETLFREFNLEMKNQDFDGLDAIILRFVNSQVRIDSSSESDFTFAALTSTKENLKSVFFTTSVINLGSTTLRGVDFTVIDIYDSRFENYKPNWFEGSSVNQLSVHKSPDIPADFARKIVGVNIYVRTACGLSDIQGIFPDDQSQLKRIDLSSNRISIVPAGVFDNLQNLEELFLEGNWLQTLTQESMAKVLQSLTKCTLYNNPLQCSNVEWLIRENYTSIDGFCINADGSLTNL